MSTTDVASVTTPAVLPESSMPWSPKKLRQTLQHGLRRLTHRNLALLMARGEVTDVLRDVPARMHRVARQTELVIEFIDDFRAHRYRAVPWWALAVGATALLYAISPADAVPSFIPVLGTLDDLAVLAVATRLLRAELTKYCEFKGYPVADYF